MKNTFRNITYTTLVSFSLVGCLEFDQPVEDTPDAIQSSGNADFSTFVALGDSLTAGFADGALYEDGQNDSFVNIIGTQMQAAGGSEFTTPLMADNYGGFVGNEDSFPVRRIFDAVNSTPVFIDEEPTTVITDILTGPFNNIGIPGAKSFHFNLSGYGDLAGLSTELRTLITQDLPVLLPQHHC